nr:hypothetical protein [Cytophagales bacterium]
RVRLKALRVYVNALNPVTITQYKGFSPEVGSQAGNGNGSDLSRGVDISIIPISAIYTVGLNIGI